MKLARAFDARRLGGNRAECAVARSIFIIWHLLSDPGARFADLGPGWHDSRADRDRKIRAHVRQLQALGLTVHSAKQPPKTKTTTTGPVPQGPRAVKPCPRPVTDSHGHRSAKNRSAESIFGTHP